VFIFVAAGGWKQARWLFLSGSGNATKSSYGLDFWTMSLTKWMEQ